jgi:hypothetical protein
MNEGYEIDYIYHPTSTIKVVRSFETKLSKYKHRMEFLRTIIGVVVLGIQIVIVYHLLTK